MSTIIFERSTELEHGCPPSQCTTAVLFHEICWNLWKFNWQRLAIGVVEKIFFLHLPLSPQLFGVNLQPTACDSTDHFVDHIWPTTLSNDLTYSTKPEQSQDRVRTESEEIQNRVSTESEQSQNRVRTESEQSQNRVRTESEQSQNRFAVNVISCVTSLFVNLK